MRERKEVSIARERKGTKKERERERNRETDRFVCVHRVKRRKIPFVLSLPTTQKSLFFSFPRSFFVLFSTAHSA